MLNRKIKIIKEVFYVLLIALLGLMGVVFAELYIQTFSEGFFSEYSNCISSVSVGIISVLTVLSIAFLGFSKRIIHKLFLVSVILVSFTVLILYVLKVNGILDKLKSVNEFREYVSTFGNLAVLLFVLIQFLQVTILPIPSFITVGAGVLLFGVFRGALYSALGIISGSIIAFLIGRVFGVKLVVWLVGESAMNKALDLIKGKDKLVLTFMFLFPFFPDDVLCFVAGITTMSTTFFIMMIIATRSIAVFCASYSMNNSLIPYNTWWGILVWILLFACVLILSVVVYKKGEKIENLIFKKRK